MRNTTTRAATAAPVVATSSDSANFHEPLPRLTNKVFTDLAIWMIGLGLLMGIMFPFFLMALGVPSRYVLSAKFFFATIGAGLVVGATNQFLSRAVVGSRLRFMRSSKEVRATISLGAVSFPSADVADLDDLIRKADAAMYRAKKTGRNRLTLVDV